MIEKSTSITLALATIAILGQPPRTHFSEQMPSPRSPAGKAYAAVFENCSRSSLDDRAYAWCGCYVRALHTLKPSVKLLDALARNPFVDGSSYMSWLVQNIPGGETLFECEDALRGKLSWGERYAPRTTACLMEETATPTGAKECRYRAAWGEFTITGAQCEREISSKRWGYRELDCAGDGAVVAPSNGPREWKKGIFTIIDYETAVAPDFVPPLPPDARSKHPLEVRLIKRETPGQLRAMSLTALTDADLMMLGMPVNLMGITGPAVAAIDQEDALLLKCTYKGQKGVRVKTYWFERVPGYIQTENVNPNLRPYFSKISSAASSCPAHME